jgi:hypothetical protein
MTSLELSTREKNTIHTAVREQIEIWYHGLGPVVCIDSIKKVWWIYSITGP